MSGGTNRTETVARTQLSPEQREFVRAVMPQLLGLVQRPPQLGEPVSRGPSPQERLALALAPQVAGVQGGVARDMSAAVQAMLQQVSRPIGGELEAVVAPLQRQLLETVLPRIRGEAVNAGQFGSSRQALAQGVATRETARAIGEAALQAAAAERAQNMQVGLEAARTVPALQAAFLQPLQTLLASGGAGRELEEAQRAEAAKRLLYEQMAPVLAAKEAAQVVFGMPIAGQVTAGPQPSGPGLLSGTLGGAMLGYGLTSMVPALAQYGPWGLVGGAALGAAAALLGR